MSDEAVTLWRTPMGLTTDREQAEAAFGAVEAVLYVPVAEMGDVAEGIREVAGELRAAGLDGLSMGEAASFGGELEALAGFIGRYEEADPR